MLRGQGPIGVVLAGGRGRRMGGDKAGVLLGGRPLAQWVVDALRPALDEVVVACRLDSELPALRGVSEAWVEPRGPHGPAAALAGVLREAGGRPVVACALGLPLVLPETVRRLAAADGRGAAAVVPVAHGELEPLIARWEPSALRMLDRLPPDASLAVVAAAVGAARLPLPDAGDQFTHVCAPEDLLHAGAVLDARRARARSAA